MNWVLQKWDFFAAGLLTVVGLIFLPFDAPKNITTELIAFFSIQSAVILPAMIFTAGILKPDGLELADAQRYHKALKAQMLFWVVLLALDFVAVVALITGKAMGWSLPVTIPGKLGSFDFVAPIFGALIFAGSLAVFRTIPFVRGVLSLLDLNSEMTTSAIKRRNKLENANRKGGADPTPMSLPEGYGKISNPESGSE